MRKTLAFILVVSMSTVLLPPPASATLAMHQSLSTADVNINAYSNPGYIGTSVTIVGDVNGDGYDDYLAIDYINDSSNGNAYMFWGRSTGFPTSAAQANVTFHADNVSSAVAYVARAGDVNNDGFADFLLGAPDADTPLIHCGAAYLFFGHAGAWPTYVNVSAANAIIRGTQMMDGVGMPMNGLGDVNGDGFDDFALSAYTHGGWGEVFLFLGKANGPSWNASMNLTHAAASFHGKELKSWAGYSLDGGDVNGDGLNDIVIGSPGSDFVFDNYKSPGYVYIVFGHKAGWVKNVDLSTSANASFMGEHYDDYAGQTVAVPGDVNGDGIEDILIGTTQNDESGARAGKVYLMMGKASGWTTGFNLSGSDASWRGEAANNRLGYPLCGAGDVNGDGLADFMMAAQINSDQGLSNQGQAYLFLGKTSGWAKNTALTIAASSWIGELNADQAPASMDGKGDINGDVLPDLIFGVPRGSSQSKIYLVFPQKNIRPTNITKVELFSDALMTKHISYAKLGDKIFVRLTAKDADPANVNFEQVRVKSNVYDPFGFKLTLAETGVNTGRFVGNFTIRNYTQPDIRWIRSLPLSRVRVEAVKNVSAFDEVSVGGFLRIDSLMVLPGGAPTLYAMKQSYWFRANITDTLGNDHIAHVSLYLPYGTGTINITWYHSSNKFLVISNPDHYIVFDSASTSSDPSQNRSVVTFKILFNWTFPDENYHSISATVVTWDWDQAYMNVTDTYKVEKHLDFFGNLKITGNHGRLLGNGVGLSPGENITMTNVIVVYKGTTNVYPPDSEFTVSGFDSDGNTWISTSGSGAFIFVTATASLNTNPHYNISIEIQGPPANCINRSLRVSFYIDAGQVAFSDPSPSANEWQPHKRVNARVNISDAGGSQVNTNSIEYRTKLNGGQWGPWTNAQLTGLIPSIEASAMVDLNDGPSNLVQWRATNGVGNLDQFGNKTTSPAYIIKVDTVAPVFSNPWPGTVNVSKKTNVSFGIRITDTLSLVKGDSIQYIVSTDNQTTWTNWTKATYSGLKSVFNCVASWTFENSSMNYVRWKATDGIGNLVFSDPVQIKVNTTPPPPPNRKPVLTALPDRTVNVGSVLKFQVNATDPDKDPLNFSLVEHPPGMVITPKGLLTFAPSKDQEGVYNVTVMVSDGRLNDTASFRLTVAILRPHIALADPNELQGDLKGKITVKGTASGGLQGIQKVEWWVDNDTVQTAQGTTSWSLVLDTTKFKNGAHDVHFRSTDGTGTTNVESYTFTVKNKEATHDGGANDILLIGASVGAITVVGIVVGAVMMRKKKGTAPPGQNPPTAGGPQPPLVPPK